MNQLTAILVFSLLLFTGCAYPWCEHPLVEPEVAVRVPEFDGAYKFKFFDEDTWLHIGAVGDGFPDSFHKFILVFPSKNKSELNSLELVGFFAQIGESYFLHIPSTEKKGEPKDTKKEQPKEAIKEQFPNGWNAEEISYYSIFRFRKTEKNIRVDLLNSKYFRSQINSNKLAGEIVLEKLDPGDDSSMKMETIWVAADRSTLQTLLTSEMGDEIYTPESIVLHKID